MFLPESVTELIQSLEARSFDTWAVGGCVRDALLGLEPQDYDLCTSAAPEQMLEIFRDRQLITDGIRHGTVSVITEDGPVEITTFRTEGAYDDNRHPGWVKFVRTVDEDLARRDFTVNAMAFSPSRGYRDPFGGQADLKNRILRCVGEPEVRFREDALRILRGARFAARFRLEIEEETWKAMLRTVSGLDCLARERVFEELCKLLLCTDAKTLCALAPIVTRAVPALAPMVGFDQHSPHHSYDVFTHTAYVVQRVDSDLALKLAALFHDCGKPATFSVDSIGRGHFLNHAKVSAEMAERILRDLKSPTALREEAVWLAEHHMSYLQPCRKSVRKMLSRHGRDRLLKLMSLHRADLMGKDAEDISEGLARLDTIRELICQLDAEEGRFTLRELAVNGRDLMEAGIPPGPGMQQILSGLLELVLSEELPNEKESLLAHTAAQLAVPSGENA